MFERTLEAQALDAGHANVSPFSIALAIHAGLIVIALGISLLIVPKVIVPPPPDDTVIKLFVEPVEFKLERPAPVQEPAIRRGVENPGPALVPPAETPRHDAPPVETPPDLPAPENQPPGEEGPGQGLKGDAHGRDDGLSDGTGTTGGPSGPGTGAGPLELTPEMVRPVLLQKIQPSYPDVARRARLEGRVTVQAVIGLDGSVESVEILRSSNPLFDGAALAAVKQWRYRPATMGGQPVRVYFVVEVGFVLR